MKQFQLQEREINRLRFLFDTVNVAIVISLLLEVTIQLLPPHYNPISQAESDLAVGPYGFLMNINFVIRGLLGLVFLVAFVRAIPKVARSRSGQILMGIAAIGKLLIAYFVTDLTSPPQTLHGLIHALVALTSFFCGALGELLLARSLRHDPNARNYQPMLKGLAIVTLIWSVVVIGTVVVSSRIGVWGLFERIYTVLFLSWMVIFSLGERKYPSIGVIPEQRTFSNSRRGNL